MSQQLEMFSVVVLGHMNPSIHSPHWYQLIGVIDEPAVKLAMSEPVLVTPEFSTFSVRLWTLKCMRERWEIFTTERAQIETIVDVAAATFAKLEYTPVSAFGLNFRYRVLTSSVEAGRQLAALADPLGLGLDTEHTVGAVTLTERTGGAVLRVSLDSIKDEPSCLRMSVNTHCDIVADQFALFDLGAMLRAAFADGNTRAEQVLAQVNTFFSQV